MAAVTVRGLLFEVRPLILEKLFPIIDNRTSNKERTMAEIKKIKGKDFYIFKKIIL